jgi:hypothetical protein
LRQVAIPYYRTLEVLWQRAGAPFEDGDVVLVAAAKSCAYAGPAWETAS